MLGAEDYAVGIAAARAAYERDQDIENTILVMKQSGFSVIECIRGLIQITGLPLAEAHRRVHFSAAWPEARS